MYIYTTSFTTIYTTSTSIQSSTYKQKGGQWVLSMPHLK